MRRNVYLAIDLGASSGRVIAGIFDGRKLALEEMHRFPNGGFNLLGSDHWNTLGLFAEIKSGLAKAAAKHGRRIASAGVDTWGVDYGLFDCTGRLLGLPHQYRDPRTNGMEELACRLMPREKIYGATGIQFMFFNTMLQLLAEVRSGGAAIEAADRILFTPDLIHYWLTGRMTNEYTIASTSQLLQAGKPAWARNVIRKLGLPQRIFKDLIQPGTVIGPVAKSVATECGLDGVKIIAPGSHDTASAVAAVPAKDRDFLYLSSGTWSLMGTESPKAVVNKASYELMFTNEGGVCGTTRLLKNMCGLWLMQEAKRVWDQEGAKMDYVQIAQMAMKAKPFTAFIYPDSPDFASSCDMPARIRAFCKRTKQKVPADRGEMARTIYESLAMRYRSAFAMIEKLTGRTYGTLHVVGGGSQNKTLNQFTANALQRPVVTGPVEATAAGNIMMQMIALKDLRSLDDGRALIRRSFPTTTYQPQDAEAWNAAYKRYLAIEGK